MGAAETLNIPVFVLDTPWTLNHQNREEPV